MCTKGIRGWVPINNLDLTSINTSINISINTQSTVTAPFDNMQTLKFKAQPANAFFGTVNQMFGGSSQLPTTAEHAVIKSLSTVQTTKQSSAVVGSWEEPLNIWLAVAKNAFVSWALNFRVCMLLKGAVMDTQSTLNWQLVNGGVSVNRLICIDQHSMACPRSSVNRGVDQVSVKH